MPFYFLWSSPGSQSVGAGGQHPGGLSAQQVQPQGDGTTGRYQTKLLSLKSHPFVSWIVSVMEMILSDLTGRTVDRLFLRATEVVTKLDTCIVEIRMKVEISRLPCSQMLPEPSNTITKGDALTMFHPLPRKPFCSSTLNLHWFPLGSSKSADC